MGEKPCGHARPQDASQLHGVCIFCYRNRLGTARSRIAELEAELAEAKTEQSRLRRMVDQWAPGLSDTIKRAEKAEAERDRYRVALKHVLGAGTCERAYKVAGDALAAKVEETNV